MLEIGLLIFGIILCVLGLRLSRKFENDPSKKEQNTGVFFQLHTQLLVNGFLLILVSLLSILNRT